MANPFPLRRTILQIKSDWDNAPDSRQPNNTLHCPVIHGLTADFDIGRHELVLQPA